MALSFPNPNSFGGGLGNAIRESFCDIHYEYLTRYEGGGIIGTPGGGSLTTPARLFHNFACNNPPPPPAPAPFSGGQCPTEYDVTYTVRGEQEGQPPFEGQQTTRHYGKIQGVFIRRPDRFTYQVIVKHGTGQDPNAGIESIVAGGTFGERENSASVSVNSIVRVDGFPDSCGNGTDFPRDEPPPGFNEDTINVTFENDFGVDFNVAIPIVYNDFEIDLNADFSIPFTLNFSPDFSFDFTLNPDGTISPDSDGDGIPDERDTNPGDDSGGGGGGGCNPYEPPDAVPDDENPPPVSPDPDIPEPETDPRSRIIRAVLVVASEVGSAQRETVIFQEGGNPDIIAPALGFISFACQVGSTFGWTADIPIKNKRQFIPCPWEGGAIDVKGTPNLGWVFTLTPVFVLDEIPTPVGG